MSYLGLPRLHFAGRFQSDVPTVNNVDQYHNNDLFEPRFQWVLNGSDYNGWFNPGGTGAFRFRGCRITSVAFPDGHYGVSGQDDPLVGAYLAEDNLRVSAKIVDVHPHAQIAPEIYGLRLRLVNAEGTEFLSADFEPSSVADQWRRDASDNPLPDLGGVYQSVLSGLRWSGTLSSPLLQALRDATQEGLLSVKFNLHGVTPDVPTNPASFFGQVSGSIGAYHTGEPRSFVAGRRLRQVPGAALNKASCVLDEDSGMVFIDLGNSVGTTGLGGQPISTGPLSLAVLVGDDAPTVLGPLDGPDGDDYDNRAGIATVTLTPEQVSRARNSRLAVVDGSDPTKQILAENSDATYARMENLVYRLYPGTADDRVTSTLYATQFGRPAAGIQVLVNNGRTLPALTFSASLTTDANGRADFWATSAGPRQLQPFIDGQAIILTHALAAHTADAEETLVFRVFSLFDPPANPTWARDIQPILQRYANLYPAMRSVLDMGNYNDVVKYRATIRTAMLLPTTAPDYMPVTRDLSPRKRDMIVSWLDATPQPPVLDIETPDDLRAALQQALLLELAVLPPYLAALFSIKANYNTEIATIINEVAQQEMLHLALAANLLNAVGGTPQIGRPGLVPTYPGRLPAPVLPDLVVRLRRCSIEQIRDVFMTIEEPEQPTVYGKKFTGRVFDRTSLRVDSHGRVVHADPDQLHKLGDWFNNAEYNPMTIGWFYNQIARAISQLDKELTDQGQSLFTGDPARQVSWPTAPGTLYQVTDAASALLAIYEIIEQGEGTPQDLDGDPDPEELGHYYRFQQIVEGRYLVRNAHGSWAFAGAPIRFDPQGVYPMVDDPDAYRLAEGSVPRRESELFNEVFTNLLSSLNQVFNGQPEGLSDAVSLMFSLQVQAKKLLDLPTADGASTVAGPAFQSPGVVLG